MNQGTQVGLLNEKLKLKHHQLLCLEGHLQRLGSGWKLHCRIMVNKGKEIISGSPYESWKPSGHLHVTPGDHLGITL